jgi:hypothetical protein
MIPLNDFKGTSNYLKHGAEVLLLILRHINSAKCQWLTPIILATWDTEDCPWMLANRGSSANYLNQKLISDVRACHFKLQRRLRSGASQF